MEHRVVCTSCQLNLRLGHAEQISLENTELLASKPSPTFQNLFLKPLATLLTSAFCCQRPLQSSTCIPYYLHSPASRSADYKMEVILVTASSPRIPYLLPSTSRRPITNPGTGHLFFCIPAQCQLHQALCPKQYLLLQFLPLGVQILSTSIAMQHILQERWYLIALAA